MFKCVHLNYSKLLKSFISPLFHTVLFCYRVIFSCSSPEPPEEQMQRAGSGRFALSSVLLARQGSSSRVQPECRNSSQTRPLLCAGRRTQTARDSTRFISFQIMPVIHSRHIMQQLFLIHDISMP